MSVTETIFADTAEVFSFYYKSYLIHACVVFVPETVLINMSFIEGISSVKEMISVCPANAERRVELVIPGSLWMRTSLVPARSFSVSRLNISGIGCNFPDSEWKRMVKLFVRKRLFTSVTLPESTTCERLIKAILSQISSTDDMLCVER